MISIKLPITIGRKFGLLISDTDVEFVSWKAGEFEKIAIFSNDDDGVARFSSFLDKNASRYRNASFRILANVIGEDYRMEKVAHLHGKFKTDFHSRRMQQLFRGVSLCNSHVQGREERGRREDIVLFYGMLTENKVLPWMKAITRHPSNDLSGVHAIAFVNAELLKQIGADWRKRPTLLMTIHEKGLLRETHHQGGDVRFSRVSKINDDTVEDVAAAIRRELERTIQYLNSLKISISDGLDIQFVCPGSMVSQLRELMKSSAKIRFFFHDAAAVAQKIGLRSFVGELGRDSSLSLHLMFSRVWRRQLASFNQIRYYWAKMVSVGLAAVFVFFGLIGLYDGGFTFAEAVALSAENSDREARRAEVEGLYNEQLGQLGDPPSSPNNIKAVSDAFRVVSNLDIVPGKLIYYFASAYEKNKRLRLNNMDWYVTDDPANTSGNPLALVKGTDIYQVLEVNGEFLPVPNESYIDVANRAQILMDSFEERGDVSVEAIELPQRQLGTDSLGGVLTDDYNVDAARSRVFRLRIIWVEYDENRINEFRNA